MVNTTKNIQSNYYCSKNDEVIGIIYKPFTYLRAFALLRDEFLENIEQDILMPKKPKKLTIRSSVTEYLAYIATTRDFFAKVQTLSALLYKCISFSSKGLIYCIMISGAI